MISPGAITVPYLSRTLIAFPHNSSTFSPYGSGDSFAVRVNVETYLQLYSIPKLIDNFFSTDVSKWQKSTAIDSWYTDLLRIRWKLIRSNNWKDTLFYFIFFIFFKTYFIYFILFLFFLFFYFFFNYHYYYFFFFFLGGGVYARRFRISWMEI